MNTAPSAVTEGDTRSQARRGLAVYFAVLVPLTAVFQAITIATGNASWILALMWSPALASAVARLVLREGFADVSFRFGGRRTRRYLLLAPIFPILFSRGRWTIRRVPESRRGVRAPGSTAPQT